MFLLYPFLHVLVYLYFTLFYFLRVTGRKNIPPRGTRLLICANHTCYSDPIFVTMAFSPFRRLQYMAKAPIFEKKWKNFFLRRLGAFPVTQKTADVASVKYCVQKLSEAKPVLVFPEGSRRLKDMDPLPAMPGVGFMAMKANCMILPVYITPYLTFFHRKKVVVGTPIVAERREGESTSGASARIAEETLEAIHLLGESVGEGWPRCDTEDK